MTASVESRIRSLCLSFPEVTERPSHGTPSFFVGKQFACVWPNGHHDLTFALLWCAAPAGAQEALIASDGDHFFRPAYVGSRGWIGIRLDITIDWEQLEGLLEDAYRCVATRRQIALLDAAPT